MVTRNYARKLVVHNGLKLDIQHELRNIHKDTITIGLSVSLKTKIVEENTLKNRTKAQKPLFHMETLRERSTAPTRFELVSRDPESLMLTTTLRGFNIANIATYINIVVLFKNDREPIV